MAEAHKKRLFPTIQPCHFGTIYKTGVARATPESSYRDAWRCSRPSDIFFCTLTALCCLDGVEVHLNG